MENAIDFFEQLWSSKKVDLNGSQALWDSRAKEFRKNSSNERVEQVVELLLSRQALDEKSEVLDIGCGVGKYTIEFAKKSKKVTGLDISPKMIEFSKKNTLEHGISNVGTKI